MTSIKKTALAGLCAFGILGAASNANADVITISTANQDGTSFVADATQAGFNSAGAITATFDYSGPLNFSNTAAQNSTSTGDLNANFFVAADISGYSGPGSLVAPVNANFSSEAAFLASSGSASNFQYGSLITIDLGVLAEGTELTITHDDGASVYQNGVMVGTTTAGPTSAVTEMIDLTSTADTSLYYARENGTPSVLEVSVPEPASFALLGVGMVGMGVVARRRRSVTRNTAG